MTSASCLLFSTVTRSVYFAMAITEGKYNLVLKGRFNSSQDVVNSFYFNVDFDGGTLVGDDGELFHLGEVLWETIKDNLLQITSDAVVYNTIDVFKADGSDVGASGFYTIPTGEGVGGATGQVLPPFVAWSFQYTRPDANYRHGYKRFAGVAESQQENGFASSGALAVLNALAVDLRSDMKLNDAMINAPFMDARLVQRIKNGVPVDPDVWYVPSTIVYKKIGSQNTRKYNVGS